MWMEHTDVIVLGAGAAGLFCAFHAAAGGRRVRVLEHNASPGKKIRISGGGRCNFTNRDVTHRNFISENPDFARSALARYTPDAFIDLVNAHGIAWHEKTLGQLFCDGSAQQIIDMLVDECTRSGVVIEYEVDVHEVLHNGAFNVRTSRGEYVARNLVVATGGLSIPSLGASDVGYRIAKHFDQPVFDPLPALVPLVFRPDAWRAFGEISGVSLPCIASVDGVQFRENLLFTHRGLSGPAILQISSFARHADSFEIDVLPGSEVSKLIPHFPSEKRKLGNILRSILPQRFVDAWPDDRIDCVVNSEPRSTTDDLIYGLKHWVLPFYGSEGFAKAEVTSGGVDTRYLSSKTMESARQNGLYFIGEVVDVTGWLGGYNFQWAWSSGYAAGRAIATSAG